MSGYLTPDTPLFLQTHDFLLWLLRHTPSHVGPVRPAVFRPIS